MMRLLNFIVEFLCWIIIAQGIEVAKAGGKHLGRPRVEYPENWEDCYGRWKSGVISAKEAMMLARLKKDSFYRLAKKYELERCL